MEIQGLKLSELEQLYDSLTDQERLELREEVKRYIAQLPLHIKRIDSPPTHIN